MKKIVLTENKFQRIFLAENKESKNISLARKYIKSKGYGLEEANKLLIQIRNDVPNSRLASCKFLLGVTRLFLGGKLNNHDNISKLNKTLKYIASDAHINEYDSNLNNDSCETLIERFAPSIKSDINQDREAIGKERFIKMQIISLSKSIHLKKRNNTRNIPIGASRIMKKCMTAIQTRDSSRFISA